MNSKTNRPAWVLICLMVFAGFGVVSSYAGGPAVSAKVKSDKIDLNSATVQELSTIPGIGPRKAEAIVEYREEHGAFVSAKDLLKVKGVGEKLLSKIEPVLTIEIEGSDLPKAKWQQ